jgi:hypothetical protein
LSVELVVSYWRTRKRNYEIVLIFWGGVDECAVASDIYQCGREKAPAATSAIQASVIADAVAAAPVF